MRKVETHFDQISLELVKRTAKPDAPDENKKQKTNKRIQTSKSKRGDERRKKEFSYGTSHEQANGRTGSLS